MLSKMNLQKITGCLILLRDDGGDNILATQQLVGGKGVGNATIRELGNSVYPHP